MRIKENEKLAPYTTFKIGGEAKFFCATKNETELRDAIKFANDKSLPMLFLSGTPPGVYRRVEISPPVALTLAMRLIG